MDIRKSHTGVFIPIKVIPGSGEFKITLKLSRLEVSVKSPAKSGRANAEVVAKLGEFFGTEVKLTRGSKQRRKEIFVKLGEKDILSKLSKLPNGGENGENRAINREIRNQCNSHRKRRCGET